LTAQNTPLTWPVGEMMGTGAWVEAVAARRRGSGGGPAVLAALRQVPPASLTDPIGTCGSVLAVTS
jgi:hypothetical protein